MAKKKAKKAKSTGKPAKKPARKAKKSAAKKPAKKAAAKGKAAKAAPGISPEKQVPGGVFLGEVEDYFAHVNVIALTLKQPLAVGEAIRVKGHTTDITQKVESMQIEHQTVQSAAAKDAVGIKIADRARKGDAVYKV